MARRYIAEEPTSRLAVWARRTALFSLVATILAIIIVRSGLLEIRPALATFVGALALAAMSLLFIALAAFVVIWKDGLDGMGYALTAIGVSVALIAYPAYLGVKSYKLPWIYDITTDPIDPPRYEALARIRPRDANPIIYAGLYAAEQQRAAYPDIEPLEEDASAQVSYNAALAVITKRRWRIVDQRAPAAAAPRGPHRGGGAHADHGISRRRGGAGARRRRRLAHRRALLLALRHLRFRHQCRAHTQPDRRHRRGRRQRRSRRRRSCRRRKKARASPKAISRRPSGSCRSIEGAPSVATSPRAVRSSRCASTESPAALVSRGSSPI